MFFPRSEVLQLTEAQLKSLRPSVNQPVVVTDELSGGPARAAIAAYTEGGEKKFGVTIVIRSLQSNQVVFYDCSEAIENAAGLSIAFEAAMSFCEAMGFVLGDDVLAQHGLESRKVGLQLWREATGEALQQAAQRERRIQSVAELKQEFGTEALLLGEADGEEIELETEVFEVVPKVPSPAAAKAPPVEGQRDRTEVLDPDALRKPAPPTETKKPSLSRFHGRQAPPPVQPVSSTSAATENGASERADENSQAIGRLKLVKRRSEGVEKASWLCRILRAF